MIPLFALVEPRFAPDLSVRSAPVERVQEVQCLQAQRHRRALGGGMVAGGLAIALGGVVTTKVLMDDPGTVGVGVLAAFLPVYAGFNGGGVLVGFGVAEVNRGRSALCVDLPAPDDLPERDDDD
jgi:hypothetical protein